MTFFKFIVIIGTIVILASFIFAFKNRKNATIPVFLKLFYLYPLLILFLCIDTIAYHFTNVQSFKFAILVHKIIIILDFVFWGYFFYSLNRKPQKFRIITVLIFFLILIPVTIINSEKIFQHLLQPLQILGNAFFA